MIPTIPGDAFGRTAISARLWFKGHAGENDLPTRNQQPGELTLDDVKEAEKMLRKSAKEKTAGDRSSYSVMKLICRGSAAGALG